MPERPPEQSLCDDAKSLAAMLDINPDSTPEWPAEDYQGIFEHQMALSLKTELAGIDSEQAGHLVDLCDSSQPVISSLADLMLHPRPPMELLDFAREYAKYLCDCVPSPIPPEIAVSLYYVSIAAAIKCYGYANTTLPDDKLADGLAWTSEQAWVDDQSKLSLREALEILA